MTDDPSTAAVICNNVRGLGITLDPSHYIYGPHGGADYEPLMKHVYHVRLRATTTKDDLYVRIGQGDVEYGRLVNHLSKVHYDRALCVDLHPIPDVDQLTEMRKMRLLLERPALAVRRNEVVGQRLLCSGCCARYERR